MQLLDNRLAGGQALHLDGERFGLHDRRHRHPDRLDRVRMLASRRDDEIPWDNVIANRIIVDHVYHLWTTKRSGTLLSEISGSLQECWFRGHRIEE